MPIILGMDKSTKTEMAYARVDEPMMERLRDLAQRDERPVSHLVRTAIVQYLKRRAA